MVNYCKELQEFHKIIHNKQLLKEKLKLNAHFQHGRPAMTLVTNFFWNYTNHPTYINIISGILNMTYDTWQDYCFANNIVLKEDLENSYCEIMSNIFKANGIK